VPLLLLALLLLLAPLSAFAQGVGRPLVRSYDFKDYGGAVYSFGAVQDGRGLIYVANLEGVLEFDGVSWRRIRPANRSQVRSIAAAPDGTVFVSAQGDFGYLSPDSTGTTNFVSLVGYVDPAERAFGSVFRTDVTGDGVFFASNDRLFRWAGGRITSWPVNEFTRVFEWKGTTFIIRHGEGLLRIEGDELRQVSAPAELASLPILRIMDFNDGRVLLATGDDGLFLFDGKVLERFETEADPMLRDRLRTAMALPDGRFAFGTLGRHGVIIIDREGRLVQRIGEEDGLVNGMVMGLGVDREEGLWVTGVSHISRVELRSPWSHLGASSGLTQTVSGIRVHDGHLYVSTTGGVSVMDLSEGRAARFRDVSGIKSVELFMFLDFDGSLLVSGGVSGAIYELKDDRATAAAYFSDTVFRMARSIHDPAIVYAGKRDGFAAIRRENGRWRNLGSIGGINMLFEMVERPDGKVWAGTLYEGIYLIDITRGMSSEAIVARFGPDDGLPVGSVYPVRIRGQIHFMTQSGIYRFDEASSRFVPDAELSLMLGLPAGTAARLYEDASGNIWIRLIQERRSTFHVARPSGENGYVVDSSALKPMTEQWAARSLFVDDQGAWFGGEDGIFRFDPSVSTENAGRYSTLIRSVAAGDSLVYGGSGSTSERARLAHTHNAMRFHFASTSFVSPAATEYQYYLEGFDRGWSEWSRETMKDYTNLPANNYRFRVRSRNIYGYEGDEAVYAFVVLPPWYGTLWFRLLIGLGIAGLVYAGYRARVRHIEARNRHLEEQVAARTEALRTSLNDLKSAQTQLVQQEKLASLGALTAGIAHEIKNPLNFVMNFAGLSNELVEELHVEVERVAASLPAEQKGDMETILADLRLNLEKISEHGGRADGIVRSMLEHSRGGRGKRQPTDLNQLVEEYVNLAYHGMRAQYPDFECALVRQYDPMLPPVEVVPQDLGRVVLNLVKNAFQAVRSVGAAGVDYRPVVTVETVVGAEGVEIRLRDNGPGIPEDARERIFEPFFTTKAAGEGTGLGLSLSHDVVVLGHGGRMEVESTTSGVGTTFTVSLPLSESRIDTV
jgi:signal transduction histidine kinase